MKRAICSIALLLSASCILAQNAGIFYTKNGSKLTGDKPKGFKIAYDQGYALGAFVDLKIVEDVELSIQPGYQKIQSVIKVPDTDDPEGGLKDTLDFRLDYFSLPLLFKIYPTNSERFYFIGGPQLGILLESKTSNENGEEQDQDEIMNSTNLSLNFGFGYKIPIKSLYLFIEARYEQGLVNITDFGNPDELFSRVKSQGINLTLGLGMPFKRKPDE